MGTLVDDEQSRIQDARASPVTRSPCQNGAIQLRYTHTRFPAGRTQGVGTEAEASRLNLTLLRFAQSVKAILVS